MTHCDGVSRLFGGVSEEGIVGVGGCAYVKLSLVCYNTVRDCQASEVSVVLTLFVVAAGRAAIRECVGEASELRLCAESCLGSGYGRR